MTEEDFLTIDYLINGSAEQQKAYYTLLKSGLFVTLKDFNPVLVGTMPLDLFVNGSDLDVCCEVYNLEEFSVALDTNFEKYIEYSVRFKILNSIESVICTFRLNDFIFEIVGQPVKITNQLAFRHMMIEYKILSNRDYTFKEAIINLKKQGIKTEPAFAQLLGLKGDPYQALLTFVV